MTNEPMVAKRVKKPTTKKPMDKTTKLTLIIAAAAVGVLMMMALIWALVANASPTEIKRVVYENSEGDEIDTEDRAAMVGVAKALSQYGIEKDDKFCLDYTYSSSSYRPLSVSKDDDKDSTEPEYSATIYWRDGSVQEMDCVTEDATSKERSKISGFRYSLEDALKTSGSRSDYYDYDYDNLYSL